jgi:hypothetical protein
MGEFVGQKMLPFLGEGLILRFSKENVVAHGKGAGIDVLSQAVRLTIAMHPNGRQIPAKSTFHE